MKETICVTGGAGYVGSIVVDELLRRGYKVRALDSLLHGSIPSLLLPWGMEGFEFIPGDIRSPGVRQQALAGADAVVHLAAIVGDPACARDPKEAVTVNVEGTRDLLLDAHSAGVRRFIFASTCSNYGKMNGSTPATEDFPLRPVSVYAETKVAAEYEVLERSDRSMACCCLRFATVFGTSPRMRFDLTVNEFTRDVTLARELVVYGEQFWRPYVHIRDAAAAVVAALRASPHRVGAQVYNVGSNTETYRKLDIVNLLQERFRDLRVRYVHKSEDPRDYRVSFDKIGTALEYTALRSVGQGMDEIRALLSSGLIADPDAAIYRN